MSFFHLGKFGFRSFFQALPFLISRQQLKSSPFQKWNILGDFTIRRMCLFLSLAHFCNFRDWQKTSKNDVPQKKLSQANIAQPKVGAHLVGDKLPATKRKRNSGSNC